MNKYWFIIIRQSQYSTQILAFISCLFCVCFRIPSRLPHYIIFSCHISMGSHEWNDWLDIFLKITLTVVRNTGQVFHRTSLNWNLSDVFLTIILGLWALGKKTSEVKCPVHCIVSWYILSAWLIIVDVGLNHQARQSLSCFSTVISPLPSILYFPVIFLHYVRLLLWLNLIKICRCVPDVWFLNYVVHS